MKVIVSPSQIKGEVKAIPSKSYAHRQLICSAFANRDTKIHCDSLSEDITATMNCLRSLGAVVHFENGVITVSPIKTPVKNARLDCGESGSTYRFLVPVVAALGCGATFVLGGRLPERPMEHLWETLEKHGVEISGKESAEVSISGVLSEGVYSLPGNISSQFISGFLLALPLLGNASSLEVTGHLESSGYLDITIDVLSYFGAEMEEYENRYTFVGNKGYYSPGSLITEGDWSNSAFWFCGAAASKNIISCSNLNLESSQGDIAVMEVLKGMGAKIKINKSKVTVEPSCLKGIEIDASEIPDLIPALAVAACSAEGETFIYNAGRLRMKESDRLFSIAETLTSLGADVSEGKDSLTIRGGKKLKGGKVFSHGDHRIVMMSAMASLISEEEIIIESAEAVNKSYPNFFDDLASLGAVIRKETL
jgi:3-phosphoshikimate 1-carboxyvinyltransferase